MLKNVRLVVAGCVFACVALAGCASPEVTPEVEILEPYPIVLSAQDIGPGYTLTGNDFSRNITICGPNTSHVPARNDDHYIGQYTNGARVVAVGIWPADTVERDYVWSGNNDIDRCASLPSNEHRNNKSLDYVIERLEGYPEEVLAFQSVAWQAPGPEDLPLSREDYANNPNVISRATARAFGVINDHLITVMITDPTDQPPTPEELRALWDAQIAKMRYHYATQTTHKLLAPPPGLDSAQSQANEDK